MTEIKKEDIKQEVFDLYDDYAHNRLDRRDFVQKLSMYAIGGLTVPALMSFLMPDYKNNVQVKADDPRLESGYITYQSPKGGGSIKGLLSKPKDAKGKLGGIIVVHENRGLNPYIEDVARRAALAGFVTLAPDALTPLGGYPGNDDKGRELQAKRDKGEMEQNFIDAFEYLKKHKDCNGKVGVVGFCFGGGIANTMAVHVPDLAAAVPFYGAQPDAADVPKIHAPLMLHYASLDTRITGGWPAYEAALKANDKKYQAFIYENVNHGFHNDTTPRYDKAAAELAWQRTIDFFKQNLS
ncbi:dienelactone hydrolase family protein [Mucilaginibacter conchicola]|uniref:Dienelactone hydrolase family protein n=1 Tax=Mucilaginibacter conchicola TaxID=2303333 RepID=A0A372NZR7_9SPHI|nr:dienelactone hydrolase family protein [Mucilaginibacter conchicola]RFZ95613.1 dienelactone hydrolase family protein [Mucilaginibacter conchicola]